MPVCSQCGQENPDVAKFCLACGAPLAPPEPAREERKLITVLFCDIVGSTAKAEQMVPDTPALLRSRPVPAEPSVIGCTAAATDSSTVRST